MLPFHKYHGIGNDFIVIETTEDIAADIVQALCDRHFGVGADGILLLSPSPPFDGRMVVLNADGSRPEMCGNGLRCAAFHLARQRAPHPQSLPLSILTDAGPRACTVELEPDRTEATVSVDMGVVKILGPHSITVEDRTLLFHRATVGNPHAVTFETVDQATFRALGPLLSTHPTFPSGANISFVQRHPSFTEVRVWERGVGPTLACGTAACAVAAVLRDIDPTLATATLPIQLPGGRLDLDLNDHGSTRMTGAAAFVYSGTLPDLPVAVTRPA